MNDRLEELWEQADGRYIKGDQWRYPVYSIDNPEKFAELIIRECVDVADKETMDDTVGYAILKHFGVK